MAVEALASRVVSEVLVTLSSAASEEINLAKGFKDDLKDMRSNFAAIQAVLRDAENRRAADGSDALSDWLKKLKDVAYDVDDLLDELQTEAKLREVELRDHKIRTVCCFLSTSTPVLSRLETAHKMRSLREALHKIAAERDAFHLKLEPLPNKLTEMDSRETFSFIDESKTVGRDGDRERIMGLLLDTTAEDVSVIPIVGMGGLGKTTLAQLVFTDRRANDEIFDPRIWICASNFDLKAIVEPILSSTNERCDRTNLESIASCLARVFTGKRYLLVLDDVWNENQEEWEKLMLLLKDGKRGSKIIVTTRSQRVAMIVKTVPLFNLKGLSDGNCWELFKRKAFEMGEEEKYPSLAEIGKEIVKKCGGVPLAANALGSMMRFKWTDDAWLSVRDSEIWRLEQEKRILPSLRLSYISMPPALKQCFAYCSIFPKHYEIDKEKLIRQWFALGFIRSPNGGSQPVEDKGIEYVDQMLWMSFLQGLEEGESFGSVRYRMHHLVHDLAQSVAGDEVAVVEAEQASGMSAACRYAALTEYMGKPEIPEAISKKLRALHLRHSSMYLKLLSHAKCLRVLDLQGSQMKKLPHSLTMLKHLRYFDISSTLIEALPDSIGSLHNLQTLYLSECHYLEMLPESIGRLPNLKTIDLTACKVERLPESIGMLQNLQNLNLSFCSWLYTLPWSLGRLEKLRTLNLEGCVNLPVLPASICCLRNLQSLNLSRCSLLKMLPESLGSLLNLSTLNLSHCVDLETIPESVGSIAKLQTLNLSHCTRLKMLPESVGCLQNLVTLNLSHYIDLRILPKAMGNLRNLQSLNLSWNITLEALPESIASLQNLRTLILYQCWGLQTLPRSLTNLLKLETLDLAGCGNLSELPEGMENMSNLRHLKNDKCWSLRGMPPGLGRLTNLQTLPLFVMVEQGSREYSSIAELEHLNHLTGELYIQCASHMENSAEDAKRAKLSKKTNLRSLTFFWRSNDTSEEEAMLESLLPHEHLEILKIEGYNGTKFSSWMMNGIESWLPNLIHIILSNIHGCEFLPSLGQLPYLQSLELRYMTGVRCIPTESYVSGHHNFAAYPSLKELHFEDLPKLEEWSTMTSSVGGEGTGQVFMFPSLKILTASGCPKLRPKPFIPLSVVDFWMDGCSQMLSTIEELGPSSSSSASLLRRLWIKNCEVSSNKWNGLQLLTKLEYLSIDSCEDLSSLPESMQHLTSLQTLKISACTNLCSLPEWLGYFTSLVSLEISCCPNLKSLPQGLQRLTALMELTVSSCNPSLKERCERERGDDWMKISHVPTITIL